MNKRKVQAAIVGLGRWGKNLVKAIAQNSENRLEFTHALTGNSAKAKSFCRQHSLYLCSSYEEILINPNIEAVVLATPHSLHALQIREAAQAGKHVFVEKPLALNLSEAEEVVRTSITAKIILAVGFNRRFLPAYNALKGFLTNGALGQVLNVEGNFSGPFGYGYSADMWRGTISENPAGGMAAMGIHMLDAMIHLLGPVNSVMAQSNKLILKAPIDDTTNILLDFASGAMGTLTTMMATPSHWKFHIFGSEGWALMGNENSLEWRLLNGERKSQNFSPIDSLSQELNVFAKAICSECNFPVTTSEALFGVAALESIVEAARTGKKTPVKKTFGQVR